MKFPLLKIYIFMTLNLILPISAFESNRRNSEGTSANLIQSWEDDAGHRRVRKSVNLQNNKERNKNLLPAGYDVNEPPPTPEGVPVYVNVSALVLDVRDIDEMHEYITMEYKLKLFWQDLRLQNLTKPGQEFSILNLDVLSRIWYPDIYIEHVKSIDRPEILSKPASLRLYPDGRVRYSARMTVIISCPMNFAFYPGDIQLCDVDMQTYGYQTHQLRLEWEQVGMGQSAARLSSRISLSNFELFMLGDFRFSFTSFSESGQAVSEYSGLRFTLVLRRLISYHLLQTYLPSIIYMLVSWLSFILPLESASERMGYCVTCLFTLTSTFSAVRQSTPTVSYIKALDVWMVGCIFCVFLTLVQHAIISKVRRTKIKEKIRKQSEKKTRNDPPNPSNGLQTEETSFSKNETENAKSKKTLYQTHAKKANLYLSLTIPLLFLLFNIVYWTVILIAKAKVVDVNLE